MVNSTTDVPSVRADMLSGLLKSEEIQKALGLTIGTKIQWWSMNHHTGQSYSETSGFVKKGLRLKYNLELTQASVHLAYTVGHWGLMGSLSSSGRAGSMLTARPACIAPSMASRAISGRKFLSYIGIVRQDTT